MPPPGHHRILLVDDDPGLLKLLSLRLEANGFQVETAASGQQALGRISAWKPHIMITDLRMQGMDGLALFDAVQQQMPSLPVIMLTAHGTIPDAVQATRKGLFSYLTKPFDSNELLQSINDALSQCCPDGPEKTGCKEDWRSHIISRSSAMEKLLNKAWRIAQSDVSVLIQSQSGTGKELLARALHKASPHHDAPFVPINCAAIPENLLESELFGHTKGAFTGADRNRKGLFEAADTGTLFLDEIGDMPLEFQAKLLRVLEDGEVRPVGATRSIPVDVRIVSATHSDLEAAIEKGRFREDLYYRLNVVLLEIPPLSRRREDIPLLAKHFLAQVCERGNCRARSFSPEAMETLMLAPWKGNIRQLLNVVEQVAALSLTDIIPESLVQNALRNKSSDIVSLAEAQSHFERNYLVELLQMTGGNVTRAARLAHRNRTEFYRLLHRHELEPKIFRHS
ncbi:sigma 54-interacting transcriptional regulator [Thiolapillus sp.]|uniref:sigma 54-interacting transcriptional regulator n=4 Tax=Thiolapillus sp. TaxID=2017437 RepID=UPI0025E203F7|nr:sigma 54-interacting transcriptional regulator [Thiolapillus sp.]